MPIIILIASTLLMWGAYWFFRMGGLDHMRERAAHRKDEARRIQARASEQVAPLRAIDDPRDAAVVLMLLIPRGRDPTDQQIAAIEQTMRGVLGFEQDVTERLTQARFIASRAQSFVQAAGTFASLFKQRLTAEERRELVDIVEAIAKIDGPSANQTSDIDDLKRLIGADAAG